MTSNSETPPPAREIAGALIRELTALADTSLPPQRRIQAAAAAADRHPVRIRVPGLTAEQKASIDQGLAAAHRAESRRTGAYLYAIETLIGMVADASGTDRAEVLRMLTRDIEDRFGA
ncbi:hypothetical protein [Nocardiopsis trehalosi]|jgi:hypothetical protein|uniref:hypothetical protein n=1 Tax=Nocardiopsis trehalosi TaxID=109329 RepID=UPI00082A46A8|nr:hypothetical protein [Nocardiopsis trehalosi]